MVDDPTNIPANHIAFCKALGRLCKEHGVEQFVGSYQPGFRDEWRGDIQVQWEQGRHGDHADRVTIRSTQNVRVSTSLQTEGAIVA